MDSLTMRHFPQLDPPARTERATERENLQRDVEAYLSHGGEIREVGNESGISLEPRTRTEQVNYIRNRTWRERNV